MTKRKGRTGPPAKPAKKSKQNTRRPARLSRAARHAALVKRIRLALGPEDERWAEELAAVLLETSRELEQQRKSFRPDPILRRELAEASRRLEAFHDFWRAHPRIHDSVPRDDPRNSKPLSAEIAALVRRFQAALARLPETRGGDASEEMTRRWLGLAVVSAFRARGIEVSRFEKGKAVRVLQIACGLLQLAPVSAKRTAAYLQVGTSWLRDLKR